jgi:hypothetical protein
MTGMPHSAGRHPVWVMLVGVSAVLPATSFLFADMPRSWMALCGVAMLVGLLSSRWALPAAIAVIGHTTYLAACSSAAWSPWTVGFAVIALFAVALIQPNHRWRILLLIVAVLVPLLVVTTVLGRSTWPAEAARALSVIGGMSLAGVAALAIMWLSAHSPEGRVARRRWVCLAVSALAFAGALRAQEPVTQHALPGWRSRLPSLSPPNAQDSGGADRRRLLTQLAALRAAGLEEADAAWAALAVLENADPKAIRKICFRGLRTGQLGSEWRQHIDAGRIACRAVRDHPKQGVEYLASILDHDSELTPRWSAALLRLRGDLFVEMKQGDQASVLYARASTTGDPFALRNSARLAIDTDLAVGPELATSSDPLIRMWLHPDDEKPEFWVAWNESLDLAALQPLRRVGVRTSGTRDTVKVAHNPERSYRAVTSKTAPHSAFRAELPPPPGRHPPGEVHLKFRNEYGFRLTYFFEGGRSVAFACVPQAANPQQILRVIPPAQCSRVWSEIVVRPAEHLQGRIVSSSLEGIFDLEEIRIVPAQ